MLSRSTVKARFPWSIWSRKGKAWVEGLPWLCSTNVRVNAHVVFGAAVLGEKGRVESSTPSWCLGRWGQAAGMGPAAGVAPTAGVWTRKPKSALPTPRGEWNLACSLLGLRRWILDPQPGRVVSRYRYWAELDSQQESLLTWLNKLETGHISLTGP